MADAVKRKMRRKEIAAYLTEEGYPIASATLAKLAVTGGGPPFEKFNGKAIYDPPASLEWAKSRSSGPKRSTSDTGAANAEAA